MIVFYFYCMLCKIVWILNFFSINYTNNILTFFSYRALIPHPGRVKKRPYGLPLLIKPLVRISRKRLSFGIVPLQEMDSLFNASTGLNHSAIVPPTSHMLTRWRFSLLSFRSYLSVFFSD